MEINKLKEINEKIVKRAGEEIEKDFITKNSCDLTDMKILNLAISNITHLDKIEDKVIREDKVRERTNKPYETKAEETEFLGEVKALMERKGEELGEKALYLILCELMEDLKVLHSRMYENTMRKIREVE